MGVHWMDAGNKAMLKAHVPTFVRGDTVAWNMPQGKVACWIVVGGPERSQVTLVGDDAIHFADNDDLGHIDEDEFCGGCGQIGCGHG